MTGRTAVLRRDVFGVELGVLLVVVPLLGMTLWAQLSTYGAWNHPPDSRYYLTMMARDLGHSLPDAIHREQAVSNWHIAPWYFANDDPTWQMVRSRVLYPALSAPFVWMFGLSAGSLFVPVLADFLFLFAVARTLQRLYGPIVAVMVCGALCFVTPIVLFSWAGTDTLAMALAAVIVANLPIDRSASRTNLVWLAAATVFIALTRQVGVLAPAMAGAGWLWHLVRERSWRNGWLAPFAVTAVPLVLVQAVTMVFVKVKNKAILGRGETTYWGIARKFVHYLKVVTHEALTYMWHSDRLLLALLVTAGVAAALRFKSDASAVFVGAAGATYLITAGVGFSSYMRYEMVMFPAAAVAAGGVLSALLGLSVRQVPVEAAIPTQQAARRVLEGVGGPAGLSAADDVLGSDAGLPEPADPALPQPRPQQSRLPRGDRWIPLLIGNAVVLALVLTVSAMGASRCTIATPATPSFAAAQGSAAYAVQPLARPPAEKAILSAFEQAEKVANGDGFLEGPFDWVHALRYRPTAPNEPGWNSRGADGTAIVYLNDMDASGGSRAFGDAITFHRRVLGKSLTVLSRQTDQYGEEITFTVKDTSGAVHHGSATTLYPIWSTDDAGIVTSLVYDN